MASPEYDNAFAEIKKANPGASDQDVAKAAMEFIGGKIKPEEAPKEAAIMSSPQGFFGPGVLSNVASRVTGIDPKTIYGATTPVLEGTAASLAGGIAGRAALPAVKAAPALGRMAGSAAQGAYSAPWGEKIDTALKNAAASGVAEAVFPLLYGQGSRLLGKGRSYSLPGLTQETTRYQNVANMPQLYSGPNPALPQPVPTPQPSPLLNQFGKPIAPPAPTVFTPANPPGLQEVARNVVEKRGITPTISGRQYAKPPDVLQAAINAVSTGDIGQLAGIVGLNKAFQMVKGMMGGGGSGEGFYRPISFRNQ